nr:retrovirus-related Pol polyprotein from transposon TNT 1-94 [Tanacetum cinerariifolium]
METYKTVSQYIRDQLNVEAKAVQTILTWINNDIYSTVDACPNACEMWKAIERLKHGESVNVQDLETNLYWEFRKFTSHDGESLESYYSRFYNMMNELIRNQCDVTNHQVNVQFLPQLKPEWQRADKIARTANPLVVFAQQQPVYHPQNHPTHYTQNSSTRSQQATASNKGKAIVNSPQPIYDQEPSIVAEDDKMSKDKEIDKFIALISLSKGMSETKTGKDAAYHREKMLLCKQEEDGIQLNAEQSDWRDDTDDDELENQELEVHYMYMTQLQEVSPDADDSGPIFDAEPLQKVSNGDHYNVFAIESEHPEQSKYIHDTYPIEQDAHNVIIDSLDISYDREEIDHNDDNNDLDNERYKWKHKSGKENVNPNLVEIVLFIFDSGCSKYMTGNLKLLINFVEKFLGTMKFGNDQIAPILGYGDRVQGAVTIKRVYYVEGLNHNSFSIGQLCDADLEVAFRKSTCYIHDLKGSDLLTGSHGTDLYSITLQDTNSSNLICLIAKATSSQAWLWHRRLSHLNFDTINLLSKNDIVVGLPKLKFIKDHLCSSCVLGKAKRKSFHTKTTPSSKRRLQLLHMDLCGPLRTYFLRSKDETPEVLINFLRLVQRGLHAQVRIVRTDKGTKFLNKTLHAYFDSKGILHQTSVARTPEQNGVVERRNHTLVEAARIMLSATKVTLFFWAEAIATTCFTQNRSLVIP